jgi:transcription initiation factor TFIIF subunit alpha
MAPTPAAMALLFHPKKKDGVVLNPVAQPKKKKVLTPLPNAVAPEPIKQDEPVSLPPDSLDHPCREYQLVTASTGGWDYDVMKFESRSSKVDPRTWEQPVKLNRKEPRRHESGVSSEGPQAVGPMLGPDGKPVIGMDGRMVMVDAEGRPIHNNQNRGQDGGGRGGGRGRGGRKFQKKTRQVFLVPEETRQLRREERFPWVLEDATGQETWHATMEEVSKSDTHAMFMPMADGSFQFVPVHRWYKYQKKPSHKVLTLEEAEKLVGS